jgi:molecular chaperone HscB
MDYFTLFGLPASYTLSLEQLAVRYQDLQRQYHPDKFASSAAEQLAACSNPPPSIRRGKRFAIR